jgi:lysosomal alpha-mannosidase
LKEFGVAPRVGWQIDPFGHSNTNVRLFREMGFDSMFFGRMDVAEANARRDAKEREWIQKPVKSNQWGEDYSIFMHFLQDIYVDPPGFCWDELCGDSPFENDPKMETYDAENEYQNLDNWLQGQASTYATENLFVTFGMDFRYQDAFMNYENMDRMIEYFNTKHGDRYFFQYTTPSMYVDALNKLDHVWPVKHDDLFPYQDSATSWWTLLHFQSQQQGSSETRICNSPLLSVVVHCCSN